MRSVCSLRRLVGTAALAAPCTLHAAFAQEEFEVMEVGVSDLSGSVFLFVERDVPGSTCSAPRLLRRPTDGTREQMVLSVLLAAQVSRQSVEITYDTDVCISNGVLITGVRVVRD